MTYRSIDLKDLYEQMRSPMVAEALSVVSADVAQPFVLVDLNLDSTVAAGDVALVQPVCPVVGLVPELPVSRSLAATPACIDVLATPLTCDLLGNAIAANPIAASLLVQLLRHAEHSSVAAALYAESLTYSTLQHGAEFAAWLAQRPPSGSASAERTSGELVLLERTANTLNLTLNRPHKRNAYSAELRDALCAALHLACADPEIDAVVLRGAGPAFCAGGDLAEFGTARDAALAHLARTTRSAASLLARLAPRVRCELHGACVGAGIELPAFASKVTARADTWLQLPEVAMGLVPGAGGTVSISRRIGRLRAAYMALSNARIDADTALAWGLVDEIVPD